MTHARRLFPLLVMAVCFAPNVVHAQDADNLIQVQTQKSAIQVSQDIEAAAKRHGYGVLAKRNMTKTLASKGLSIKETVMIFDLCSPQHAKKAIDEKVAVATVLPCSIAVWERDGRTTMAMVKPTRLRIPTKSITRYD
ncbi:DUF302 domain-containing protein [Myxococcota bacterium]